MRVITDMSGLNSRIQLSGRVCRLEVKCLCRFHPCRGGHIARGVGEIEEGQSIMRKGEDMRTTLGSSDI